MPCDINPASNGIIASIINSNRKSMETEEGMMIVSSGFPFRCLRKNTVGLIDKIATMRTNPILVRKIQLLL